MLLIYQKMESESFTAESVTIYTTSSSMPERCKFIICGSQSRYLDDWNFAVLNATQKLLGYARSISSEICGTTYLPPPKSGL